MSSGPMCSGVVEFLGPSLSIEMLRGVVNTIKDVQKELLPICSMSRTWRLTDIFSPCNCASYELPRSRGKHPASCHFNHCNGLSGLRLGEEYEKHTTSVCSGRVNTREKVLLLKAAEAIDAVIACQDPTGTTAVVNHTLRIVPCQRHLLRIDAVLRALQSVITTGPCTCGGILEFNYDNSVATMSSKRCDYVHANISAHSKLLTVFAPLTALQGYLSAHLVFASLKATTVSASQSISEEVQKENVVMPCMVHPEAMVRPADADCQRDQNPCNEFVGAESFAEQPVIVDIPHAELFAIVCPLEAAVICTQLWASSIEALAQRSHNAAFADDPPGFGNIVFLTCNRQPEALVTLMCESKSLRACRAKLDAAGLSWRLPCGAFVFVHPEQYELVMRSLDSFDLQARHIVITCDLEYLLEEAIADIGQGAWMKAREQMNLAQASSSSASSSATSANLSVEFEQAADGSEAPFEVTRSFLCFAPPRRNANSVCKSATEAVPGAGFNPRRALARMSGL